MGLSIKQINKILEDHPSARKTAVTNFLFSKTGESMIDEMNLKKDAELYKWSISTVRAIRKGIKTK